MPYAAGRLGQGDAAEPRRGLDVPDTDRVVVGGHEVTALGEARLRRMRRETVGCVFPSFGLVPVLSAAENVGVALRLTRTPVRA